MRRLGRRAGFAEGGDYAVGVQEEGVELDVAEVGAEVGEGVGGGRGFGVVGGAEGVEEEGCEELGVGVGEEWEGQGCIWV